MTSWERFLMPSQSLDGRALQLQFTGSRSCRWGNQSNPSGSKVLMGGCALKVAINLAIWAAILIS